MSNDASYKRLAANISRHYVAFIRKDGENGQESKWVLFNDEKVVEA